MKKETKDNILTGLALVGAAAIVGVSTVASVELFENDINKLKTGSTYECIEIFRKAYNKIVDKGTISIVMKDQELEDIKFIVTYMKQKEYGEYLSGKLTRLNNLYHIYY